MSGYRAVGHPLADAGLCFCDRRRVSRGRWSPVISSMRDTHMLGKCELSGITNGGRSSLSVLGRAGMSIITQPSLAATGNSSERISGVVGEVAMVGSRLEARLRSRLRPSTAWKSPSYVQNRWINILAWKNRTHRRRRRHGTRVQSATVRLIQLPNPSHRTHRPTRHFRRCKVRATQGSQGICHTNDREHDRDNGGIQTIRHG